MLYQKLGQKRGWAPHAEKHLKEKDLPSETMSLKDSLVQKTPEHWEMNFH